MTTTTAIGGPVKVEMSGDGMRLAVTFEYNPNDVKAIKYNPDTGTGVPGARFRPPPEGPVWLLPKDMTSARCLREAFGDRLALSKDVIEWGREERDREEALRSLTSAEDATLPNLKKMHPKLHDWMHNYQRAGAAFMATAPCLNADQPGTGKTIQTIASILERAPEGQHLIVAPKTSLDPVWADHFEEWTDIPYLVLSGEDSKEERLEILECVAEWHEEKVPFVLITNPATVTYEKDKDVPKEDWPIVRGKLVQPLKAKYPELFEYQWSTIVFDEYHKMGLSNDKTNAFQAFNDLKAEHKLLLSGTPMGGKPVKLWGALHFLYPESFTSKWRWVDQWLDTEVETVHTRQGTKNVKKVYGVRPNRQAEFDKHLQQYMVRRLKSDVIKELPPKQRIDIWVEMTPKQRAQYDSFAESAELKIEEENLTATGILAEYARLKQFSNAHQKAERVGEELVLLPTYESGKLPQVLRLLEERGIVSEKEKKEGEGDWVEESDEQVVIFSQSSRMVDMVHRWLNQECGIKAEKITGAVTQKRRSELVAEFQAGECRVMVVTTTAAGVALTLDRASTAIILDETWDPDDQEQAEDRIHRASRIHQVMCYYIRSKDSIESRIKAMTDGKQITNREILDMRNRGLRAI